MFKKNIIGIVIFTTDFSRFTQRQLNEIYKSVSTENLCTTLLHFVNSEQIGCPVEPLHLPCYLNLLKINVQTFISEFRKR